MNQNQNQSKNQLKSVQQAEFDRYRVIAVGKVNGPPNPITQKPTTFCVVLGLFTEDGVQAVHKMKNGEERPIVWLSLPFPIEEEKILL